MLGERLDARVALFGSSSEAGLCAEIAASIGPRAENVAGQTTLTEFIDFGSGVRCVRDQRLGGDACRGGIRRSDSGGFRAYR